MKNVRPSGLAFFIPCDRDQNPRRFAPVKRDEGFDNKELTQVLAPLVERAAGSKRRGYISNDPHPRSAIISSMKKIVIIGPSGAGKTTLARELSEALNIPSTELDSLYFQENWQPRSDQEFKQEVLRRTKSPAWIFCGNYYSKLGGDLWKRADTVIWCDYPFSVVFPRLLRRTVRRARTGEELWNGNRESFRTSFMSRDSILLWFFRAWRRQRRRHAAIFSDTSDFPGVRFIRLRRPSDARRLLRSVSIEK